MRKPRKAKATAVPAPAPAQVIKAAPLVQGLGSAVVSGSAFVTGSICIGGPDVGAR